ncbi:hypothetical protein LINPERHAP2_LOCUS27945 [Linum perenne]
MAETTPRKSQSETEEEEKHGKHHNFIEKAKEKIEKVIHSPRRHRHDKETHGTSNDIDETTSVDEVKGPNVFQRAKEEIEALVETIHPKKEKEKEKKHHYHDKETHGTSKDIDETTSIDEVRGPNVFQRTKEEIEALVETMHHKKEKEKKEKEKEHHHHHDKETHGTSDDIDETTSINEVKGPNVFQRAKEEIEALVETMHHKKDEDNKSSQHHN